ncbi:TetR/AcrR family transcriptional regulator [Streptosporangium sp. NBC_01495]|uniref:TetR/AcrR family transcriptional regulator n=1 Tax=Streptosporangium sp. NBC_01495 TaxID=2903899 RepID=UPI002E318BD9|nr:TetR/AcrR family transcriptional regulator [Streptosporangium sp. NBC_01495]
MAVEEDPERTVELLWREPRDAAPRQGLSLDAIVRAAVEIADVDGIEGLSMRRVGERLGFTSMSLYRHVPGKAQLVDLMCDAVMGNVATDAVPGDVATDTTANAVPGDVATDTATDTATDAMPGDMAAGAARNEAGGGGAAGTPHGWREAVERWARRGWALCHRHPWLAGARGTRHVPGPNSIAHFEYALSTVAGIGLKPSEMVAVVGLVGRFVDSEAARAAEISRVERHTGVSEEEWWGARSSLYEKLHLYPTLTRVWEAGGYDEPEDSFEFGLRRVLDGVEALVRERDVIRDESAVCAMCGTSMDQAETGRPRAYCSRACQQRAYRRRHRSTSGPGDLPGRK